MKNMKKRCLSLALSFCLLLSLLPTPARAAETPSCDSTHSGWTGISSLGGTLSGGKYYLSGNVIASEDITISGNVTLCLKGKELSLKDTWDPACIQVNNSASLTVCDCSGDHSGQITGSGSTVSNTNNGAIKVNGGTLALESGSISDNSIPGVYVSSGGSFTMSGGTISGNKSGVSVVGTKSKFEMTGGTISDNTEEGVSVDNGTFTMSGGTISDNTEEGVSVDNGTFTMSGNAHITENSSYGVYVKDSGKFTMSGDAQITGNNEHGVSVGTSGSFTMSGGTISGNNGGVSVASSNFDMSGGIISENTSQNGSGGVSLSEGGTFNMSGTAQITGNAGNSGGGVSVSEGSTFIMSGNAEITGNTAVESGGVAISTTDPAPTVTLSGDVQITGNTAGTDQAASNLDIPSTRTINIGEGGLTGKARIGVCTNDYPDPGQTRAITTETNSANLAYFTSDAPDQSSIVYKGSAIHLSGDPTHRHKLSFNYAPITTIGGKLSASKYYLKENVTASDNITIDGGAVYLCLNGKELDLKGHTITVNSGSLFIYDCADNYSGSGQITGGPENSSAITVQNQGSLTLGSGTITGNPGGGIRVNSNGHLQVHDADGEGNGTVNVTGNGSSNVSLAEGSKINIGFATGRLFNIGVTMDAPGVFTKGWPTHMSGVDDPTDCFISDDERFGIKKDDSGELMLEQPHEHGYTYSVSTDDSSTIIEICSCGHSATATLSAPTSLTYDGSQKQANVTYSTGEDENNAWVGGDLPITYQKGDGTALEAAPTDAGTYTATITAPTSGGDQVTASVGFTIKKADQGPPTSSDYTIDYQSETITNIASGCKVYTAQTGGKEVTAGFLISDYLGGSLYIRKEATNNYNASGWATITLAARPAAPTVTAEPESIKGKGDGKVTGVNKTMEYRINDEQNWQDCTGNEIPGLAAGTTVKVRVKATLTAPHGEEKTCTIGESGNTLTVTFEENGGSAVDDISNLSYGATISAPNPAPTKSGYTFAGWYQNSSLTNQWNFATDKVTGNITLYAKWVLEAPTVELEATTENNGIYNGGETVITLTATASHSGGELTYAWYKDGSLLSDATEQSLTLTEVADSGNYRVVVTATDGDRQTATAEASLGVVIAPAPVEIPDPSDTKFTYNGEAQTYPIPASPLYQVTNNQQTDAGTYPVTVALNDKNNYIWAGSDAEDRTYSFTIASKTITATWSGLDQVYGATEDVKVTLSGVVDGDDVTATVDEVSQTAGSYPLTATLSGDDAPNYNLKNGTKTLTIQKKPVVITVTNNVTTADHVTPPTIQAPDDLTAADYQISYKDEDGEVVSTPTDPGSYEVWVKFPDGSNYCHPDGSSEKQVGSFIIAETMPTLYTVTFAGNGADTGSMTNLEAVSGSVLTLPECRFGKTGSQFAGWLYDGKTYQPGDNFTMPAQNVTFTAQWQQTYGITVTVQEPKPEGEEMQKVSDAVVSLWLGANKLREQITCSDGEYNFSDLLPGIYNLVVTKDDRTVTKKVEIKDQNAACSATLPQGATNSIVKVTEGSPDIVVGNLDKIFDTIDNTVYTPSDADTVTAGGKVEFTFTADEKQQGEDTTTDRDVEKISETNSDSVTLGLVMDYKLTKEVFDEDGIKQGESQPITESNVLLEILLPLPAELQGKANYTIYRVHDGEVQELTTTPNALEEYFTVSSDKTGLTLHVKCFSTYVVGYGDEPSTPTTPSVPSTPSGYPPVKTESENGSFTVSPSRPNQGQTVTIIPKPDEGYQVGTVTVTDRDGKPVKVTEKADGTYTFTQPNGSVTITVTFREITSVSDCPRDETCPLAAFTDVKVNAWYHDGVHYCLEHGLMSGYGHGIFGPNNDLSRGMLVQVLYNLEGCPSTSDKSVFDDVAANAWYADAVNWAVSVGVVAGYGNGKYGPNDPITREQLATILYHYAQYKEYDVSVGEDTDLVSYTDASEISEYAIPAMRWACGAGVISGVTTSTLVPSGAATRAQVATMLMHFAYNVAK